MVELETKKVDFYDSELIGVQEAATGKVLTTINNVLRDIGFGDRQIEHQRNKWKEGEAVSKRVQESSYPSEGGAQETYYIDIMKLPLTLAKINITPEIKKENPRLAEMLELYQDKCAEVLTKSFFRKQTDFIKSYSTKAASVEELANLMKEWGKALRDTNGDPEKTVELYEKPNRRLGMGIPSDLLSKKRKKNQQLAYALIPMDSE